MQFCERVVGTAITRARKARVVVRPWRVRASLLWRPFCGSAIELCLVINKGQ